MGETASEKYVSFQNDLIEHKSSHKLFDWILNYPFFNENRSTNLTQGINNANLNYENGIDNANEQADLKNEHIVNNEESYLKRDSKELTTTIIKKELNKNNYNVIHNSKFYVNIIKKSESMYKVYNDNLKEEERNKKTFEKAKEKLLKKQDNSTYNFYSPPNLDSIKKKKNSIILEEFNPFFNFFEQDPYKNIYHTNLNFPLKINMQFNRYFHKVITNLLMYHGIKKNIYVIVLNIINEISKHYYNYDYDILNNIKVKYFPYKNIKNSFYLQGLVFSNCSVYFDNLEIKNPKILLMNTEKASQYETLGTSYHNNYNYVNSFFKKFSSKNVNIILVHGELHFYIKKLLMSKKIYFFTSIKKKKIFRLSKMLRTKVLYYDNFNNFNNSYIAKANYFKIQKYKKNIKNIYVCCNNHFITLCIFGKQNIRDSSTKNDTHNNNFPDNNKTEIASRLGPSQEEEKNKMKDTHIEKINNSNNEKNSLEYYFKNEIKRENILENLISIYYKKKNDDYIMDYNFLHKAKKISFLGKEKNENKKKLLINHLKNVIIIKKVKKIIKYCIFLTFHIYKQMYLNHYMGRILVRPYLNNISINKISDKDCIDFYEKLNNSIISSLSSLFLFYNVQKIKITPINLMYNLFHLINIQSPLIRERMKILYTLIKPNDIIKEQIYNNYEHCFFDNAEKNKIIDIVNYFIFNSFMKNYESNYDYIYYYLNIINTTYLQYTYKDIIINDDDLLNNQCILNNSLHIDNNIQIENKVNEKVEKIIAKNILFYCYNLEISKNIEMITYFICPNYMHINNTYNNINMYFFGSKHLTDENVFYNFFFNYKYICDISIQQFVEMMHSLSFTMICPLGCCSNYLIYHQICIQILLKGILITMKKVQNENIEDEQIMTIICTKCYATKKKIININFTFSEFMLTIIHGENYKNVQCNHSGKYNSYEISFKNIKITFHAQQNYICKVASIQNEINVTEDNDSNIIQRERKKHKLRIKKNNIKKIVLKYIEKHIKNIIRNNVFYYFPCVCITKEEDYNKFCSSRKIDRRRDIDRSKWINDMYNHFNIYNIIETFPLFTISMLPMYCSLKYLIYNCAINYYRSKNKHLYEQSREKNKKENFNNSYSPIYFRNKCKKCKYLKISNFSILVFFNMLFIIKRIFCNFYISINFVINLLNKNIFIKSNDILYCLNCISTIIQNNKNQADENFKEIEKEWEHISPIKPNLQESLINYNLNEIMIQENIVPFNEQSNKEYSKSRGASNTSSIQVGIKKSHSEEFFSKLSNNTIRNASYNNKFITTNREEYNFTKYVKTFTLSYSNIGDLNGVLDNQTNKETVIYGLNATNDNISYILNDIYKIKDILFKKFIVFKKYKKKMEYYKKKLIYIFKKIYFYAITSLKKNNFTLNMDIFFSLYIMLLERINFKIQKNIEKMTKFITKPKLHHFYISKSISKKERKNGVSFYFENIRKLKANKYTDQTNKTYAKVHKNVDKKANDEIKKWKEEINKLEKYKCRRRKCKKNKVKNKNLATRHYYKVGMYNNNASETADDPNMGFTFVQNYDVYKLYMKEAYYIYNIENYRKKNYIDDINKEENENSNKKQFYAHISKIVDLVRSEKNQKSEEKGKINDITNEQDITKENFVFLFNQNDIANLIFHSLISNEYNIKLKKIYEAEEENIMEEKKSQMYNSKEENNILSFSIFGNKQFEEEGNRNNALGNESTQEITYEKKRKRFQTDSRILKRRKHSTSKKLIKENKEVNQKYDNGIDQFIKSKLDKLLNVSLKNNMINEFINSKSDDCINIALNDNITVSIYFPLQFYYLRKHLCKKEESFLISLIKSNYINFDHKKKHFIKTYDDKYIIKEINAHEFKSFITRYKEFFRYFSNIFFKSQKSAMCFLFGLYQISIKKPNRKTLKSYIILENIKIANHNSKVLIFDIKGARKKKNIQKLIKQSRRSISIFDKNYNLSLNTCKLTQDGEKDESDNCGSGISMNLNYFNKYLKNEKKIKLICRPHKNKNKVEKSRYIYPIEEKGEDLLNSEMVFSGMSNGIQNESPQKKMHTHNISRSNNSNSSGQSNEQIMHWAYINMRKKMMRGLNYHYKIKLFETSQNVMKFRNRYIVFKMGKEVEMDNPNEYKADNEITQGKDENDSKKTEINNESRYVENIFMKEIIANTKMYLSINRQILNLKRKKKKKIDRTKRRKKKIQSKNHLYYLKRTLYFLRKKNNYILNRDNLSKHIVRHNSICEEKYDFIDKDNLYNKNLETLNSIEKYHHFVVDNYNSYKGYTVLFDDNFRDYIKSKVINLEYKDYKYLMDSLKEDSDFLCSQDIMDYSLLIHIDISNHVIIFKIIDYLRPYTWDKSVENFSKSVLYLTKGYRPTIIQSEYYKKRFLSNIKKYVSFYIPIHALNKDSVFKIGSKSKINEYEESNEIEKTTTNEKRFSIITLNKNNPYRKYFFYNLFNIIIRYYGNFHIYMKYFGVNQNNLHMHSFGTNIYSKRNLFIFLSYYAKEMYIKMITEKEEEKKQQKKSYYNCSNNTEQIMLYMQNRDPFFMCFNNVGNDGFRLIQNEDKNDSNNKLALHRGRINSEVPSPNMININLLNSNFININNTNNDDYNKMIEIIEYLRNPIFPYYTVEQYNFLNYDYPNVRNNSIYDDIFSQIYKNTLYFPNILNISDKKNDLINFSKIQPNFFFNSTNNSFDINKYKRLQNLFYNRISEFQITILRKLQKHNFNIESISNYVENNLYIEMNDVNLHHNNINYLDVYNIFNICEKNFNTKYMRKNRRKGNRKRKDNVLLYIPSYFLFALEKK
ncbi:conserved Plasmodium protein, unknown function [Plasmodium chabaudi adami]|uniref:PIPK domain-containing protein n=1 Tax=Plasmodium chabaudi adami TaxID=5826 RepID=A0A1C6XS30_PLACE|nr:conserved Plasmodium protein, unknown function [Plasmodium chabaudi adami]